MSPRDPAADLGETWTNASLTACRSVRSGIAKASQARGQVADCSRPDHHLHHHGHRAAASLPATALFARLRVGSAAIVCLPITLNHGRPSPSHDPAAAIQARSARLSRPCASAAHRAIRPAGILSCGPRAPSIRSRASFRSNELTASRTYLGRDPLAVCEMPAPFDFPARRTILPSTRG